jgi:hypothetical protein
MKKTWRADPLVWGHGPRVFEMFLEPTCPFSVKAFGKLDDLLGQAGEDRITVKLRLQSQPWHMYSGVIVRCILAASTLKNGKAAAKSVMAAVAAHREEFEFDRHCGGPNLGATPNVDASGIAWPSSRSDFGNGSLLTGLSASSTTRWPFGALPFITPFPTRVAGVSMYTSPCQGSVISAIASLTTNQSPPGR